jgi:cyclophilin family peptidyl-prolyl cis-trans isomerase
MRRSIAAAIVIALLGTSAAFAQDQAPPPASADQGVPAAGADQSAAPADAAAPPPPIPLNVPTNPPMTGPQLLIQTSMGDIILQLDSVRAPKSVANVVRYAREKHYDGTVVYRVVKGFIIQMGSWDANVKGRPVHKPVVFEGNNGLLNLRGTVALGHGDDPNSATADFFINLADNTGLDRHPGDPPDKPGYAVFGEVTSGMDVADRISQVPVGDHGPMPGQAPVDPILIKKVTVIGDAAAPTASKARHRKKK